MTVHGATTATVCPTRVRYRVLAAACLLALIAYIHRVGFAQGGTFLKRDLGFSDGQWGIVMAAFLVSYALFEIPWGVLGDWLGARHLLTLMVLGWSLFTAAVALVPLLPGTEWLGLSLPLFVLLFFRFVFGAFQAGAFPTFSRMMADWMSPRERGTAQGTIWMCSRIGGAVAPFLMLALIKATGGAWDMSFVLVALPGVVWCAFFWPWFRNRPEEMPQVNAAERELIAGGSDERPNRPPAPPSEAVAAGLPPRPDHDVTASATSSGHANVPWGRILRCRSVWFLCFTYGFGGLSGNFFITLLPQYLVGHRGLTHEQMQWLTGLPLACGIVGCLGGGLLSDWFIRKTGNRKWGRRLTGMIGTAAAGLCLLAVNWVADVRLLGVLLCVTFFGNDLGMGPAWASCADVGERFAGTIGGAMNMFANLTGALSAVIAGFLFGKVFILAGQTLLGNEMVFWIFACSYWLACLSWLGVDVTRPVRLPAAA
jgi:MFS transporter, ACS family, glucarate transporter